MYAQSNVEGANENVRPRAPEVGRILAQARTLRGLTLEDCERDTRISKRYLDALEREDWDVFPAPVYSRAFLRTYAQYLGEDPSELMRVFRAKQEEPEFKPLPEIPAPAPTGSINWVLAGAVVVFLAVAGVFVYLSSDSGGGNETVVTQPTVAVEAEGGGPQPDLPRPLDPNAVEAGVVPDLSNVRVDDALAALDHAGLSYVVVETDSVQGEPGVVVSQDPQPGTEGGSETSVTLVVPRQ